MKAEFSAVAFQRWLARRVQPTLLDKAREIALEAQAMAPRGATGQLADSIHAIPTALGARVEVSAPHAGFVHQGTGPGHVPNPRRPYFPKLRKRGLILWSESKDLNPYAVARGIAANGTPAQPFLADAIDKVLGRLRYRWIRRELEV